ncbi:HlyD family secretion protein [Undibacterium sp. Ji49W]|uniref:HlyD family secretion protein n=1 Tax=Undibacterium sp. Ji49W TaxID=3413040 RepID=UPI003BF39907
MTDQFRRIKNILNVLNVLNVLLMGSLPLLLSACKDKIATGWSGYAEGEYVYISAPLGGRLDQIRVQAGQQVSKDAPLFSLDAEVENAARDEAQARLLSARAQASNTEKGRRSEEIAVSQAQLASAQAQAALARQELARQQQLLTQGFVSKSRIDDAQTNVKLSEARVAELSAALSVARLPARVDERAAAQASADAAKDVVRQSAWRSDQKNQVSPTNALVAEVFYRQGEYIQAGQPVLSLLPPENRKARFFVPEAELGSVTVGQAVKLNCDGCGAAILAHISRIASKAEYTPPVIYSNVQRAKLVFLVEAIPDQPARLLLHPGQPLDVSPVSAVSNGTTGASR